MPSKTASVAGDQESNTWAYSDILYSNENSNFHFNTPVYNINYFLEDVLAVY
jgi:hypothetical protein